MPWHYCVTRATLSSLPRFAAASGAGVAEGAVTVHRPLALGYPPAATSTGVLAKEPAMAKHKFLNPDTIAKPIGYTHVVERSRVRRGSVYIAGQLGLDPERRSDW